MVLRVSHRLRALGAYLFALSLAYLAAAYLGGFFVALAGAMLVAPMASFALLLAAYHNVRYHQNFSTERPMKGDRVVYTFDIHSESVVPIPLVRISFQIVHPSGQVQLAQINTHLSGSQPLHEEQVISLPYRGIYTVGFERLEFHDTLRLFTLRAPVFARTFYVYPRVLPLQRSLADPDGLAERPAGGERDTTDGQPDYALFREIRDYRPGESIRHLAWRKFAAVGTPLIKVYHSAAAPAVRIYLDLRPVPDDRADPLQVEDVSVEITVALVNHYLQRQVPVTVRAASEPDYLFSGSVAADFADFYQNTFDLQFRQQRSPGSLLAYDRQAGEDSEQTTVLVSHAPDAETFQLVEASLGEQPVHLILNTAGWQRPRDASLDRYLVDLRNRGARITEIAGGDQIAVSLP